MLICSQLVGYSLKCSRCHSLTSCCNVYCQIICKDDLTIYITIRSSFNISLIATRVTFSIPPCGILKSVWLFCELDPPTLTLIYHSPTSSLMNFIILPCISTFSNFVFSVGHFFLDIEEDCSCLLHQVFLLLFLILHLFCFFSYEAELFKIYILSLFQVPD